MNGIQPRNYSSRDMNEHILSRSRIFKLCRALVGFYNFTENLRNDNKAGLSVEFALLAIPFFFVIFAIAETTLSFTAQQMLSESAERISRDVKTGLIRHEIVTSDQLRLRVCNDMRTFINADCDQIFVDLQSYPLFQDIPTSIVFNEAGDIVTLGFSVQPGVGGTINQLRLFYRYPWFTDFIRARLSGLPNGRTLLYSSEIWRNEPFI